MSGEGGLGAHFLLGGSSGVSGLGGLGAAEGLLALSEAVAETENGCSGGLREGEWRRRRVVAE